MTRLTETHINETTEQLQRIDLELSVRTGFDLRGVALQAIQIDAVRARESCEGLNLAVVPMTSGEGVISGFAEALCAITSHVGFNAWKARGTDVAGIAEAYASRADILMLADDHCFVAVNTRSRSVANNNRATGEGFAALLDMMADGIAGRACGVIGCGPVGSASAFRLARMGAELTVCDRVEDRARRLAGEIRAITGKCCHYVKEVESVTQTNRFIVDATPSPRIIHTKALTPETVIVAPGVPHGLTPKSLAQLGRRFYHDNLPLGVATMALAAAFDRLTEAGAACP